VLQARSWPDDIQNGQAAVGYHGCGIMWAAFCLAAALIRGWPSSFELRARIILVTNF